jgi:hypothetical protein
MVLYKDGHDDAGLKVKPMARRSTDAGLSN